MRKETPTLFFQRIVKIFFPSFQSFYSSQISPSSTSTNKQLRDPFRQLPKEEEEPEEVRDAHPLLGGWSTVKRVEPEEENEEGEQTSVK